MTADSNIYLIGYMGCGKTVVGEFLSSALHRNFADTDRLICRRTGLSVNDIFTQFGEEEFRRLEQEVVNDCTLKSGLIVATGGGVVEREENLQKMLKNGLVVYLQLSINVLVERLQNAKEDRPLLRDKKPEELKAFIANHLNRRKLLYEKAHIIFDAQKDPPELLKIINNYSM